MIQLDNVGTENYAPPALPWRQRLMFAVELVLAAFGGWLFTVFILSLERL